MLNHLAWSLTSTKWPRTLSRSSSSRASHSASLSPKSNGRSAHLKTVDIKIRPIHHWLESGVRAHIFLCMLAYDVSWHLIEAWHALLFADEGQATKAMLDPVTPVEHSATALEKSPLTRSKTARPFIVCVRSSLNSLHKLVRLCSREVAPRELISRERRWRRSRWCDRLVPPELLTRQTAFLSAYRSAETCP
jgi:hypothetical protein